MPTLRQSCFGPPSGELGSLDLRFDVEHHEPANDPESGSGAVGAAPEHRVGFKLEGGSERGIYRSVDSQCIGLPMPDCAFGQSDLLETDSPS